MPTTSRRLLGSGRRAAPLLVSVALLSSCGGGTEPLSRGSYNATITGGVNETAAGPAGFMTVATGWSVMMLPAELANGWDIFLRGSGSRPPTGTIIPVRPNDPGAPPPVGAATADVSLDRPNRFEFWMVTSGQIRITASSESRLSGTFELSADPIFDDGPGPITVTGSFDAIFLGGRPTGLFP